MICLYPRYLPKQDITVPCGKCLLCRIAKSREWTYRLLLHSESCNHVCAFLTFTYSNDDIGDGQVHKSHLQGLFKRFRRFLDYRKINTKIQYFACGEYGGITGRPHYHAIIFGFSPDFYREISVEAPVLSGNGYMIRLPFWDKGLSHVAPVEINCLKYVSRYILKKVGTFKYDPLTARCLYSFNCKHYSCSMRYSHNPPFQLVSQKLGLKGFFDSFFNIRDLSNYDESFTTEEGKEHLFEFNRKLTLEGSSISVPRYFKDKFHLNIKLPDEDEFTRLSREYYEVFNSKDSGWKKFRLKFLEKKLADYDYFHYNQKRLEIDKLSNQFK